MSKVDYSNYNFPQKAKYVRDKNRIYLSTDFESGEELTYHGKCGHRNSNANGYRFYRGARGNLRLIHISEIEEILDHV